VCVRACVILQQVAAVQVEATSAVSFFAVLHVGYSSLTLV